MTVERKGRRPVTAEERKLWKTVAKEFVPLDRNKPLPDEEAEVNLAPTPAPRPAPKPHGAAKAAAPKKTAPLAKTPSLADFEARRAKRLSAGRIAIEARLDLHGMRQEEAREALMRFLRSAQANGLRHVKVITGKGVPERDAELKPFSLFEENRRGVLRDQAPRWLQSPEARSLVVSFTEAGRGHGGSGALYVQIRKKGGRTA
jgi:DNA-nicking Smr family endonuclease